MHDADGAMAALVEFARRHGFDKLKGNKTEAEGGVDTTSNAMVGLWRRRTSELVPEEIARNLAMRTMCNRHVHNVLDSGM